MNKKKDQEAKEKALFELRAERMRLLEQAKQNLQMSNDDNILDASINAKPKLHSRYGQQENKNEIQIKRNNQTRVKLQNERLNNPESQNEVLGKKASRIPEKSKLRTKAAVKPHQFQRARPGYTWNMGGRLKEIRIRNHYKKVLLRKVIFEWKELWWKERKEWKLTIRAECHNRYRLWRQTWSAWVQYVVFQRVKNAKITLACRHSNQKIQQRALAGWLEYHKAKRSKTSVYKALEKAVAHKHLKKAWAVWRDRLQRAKFLHDQEVYALHFWAETLTHKMFERWKLRMREKQKEKDREVAADHLYNQFLVARCFFQGFLPYTMYRLEKKKRTAIAATSYIERLSTKYFHHWHTRWYTKKIMAEKSHQIKVMGQRAMLRRILIHWKFYIFLEQEKALKIKLATEHYQARLLTIGLRSFKHAVHIHKQKKHKEDIARNYQSTVLIKMAWNQWMLRCDEKDELKIVNQSRRAWSYYKKKTLRRCFGILQKYTTWRKHRKSQYVDADAFFAYKMLPKCLHCMHRYAKMRQEKRQRQIASEKFRRECLLGSVFFRWMFSYRASQDYRMMQRMAILHYDDQITRRNLKVWRKATQEKLSEEKKIETACQHYYSKLVLKMLSAWKTYTKLEFRSKNQDVLAYKHSVHQTTKKAWKAWAMYVARQQVKGHKKAKADVFYQQGLQRKVLEAWKTYYHGIMAVYEEVNAKKTRHDRHRLHEKFQHWRQTIQDMVVDRHKLQIADNMYAVKLKALVFKHWYHYTILHVGLRDDEDHRVEHFKLILNTGKLKHAFSVWVAFTTSQQNKHHLNNKARCHYEVILKQKMIVKWKEFNAIQLRKRLLQHQSIWLHNTRLLSFGFNNWRTQYHNSLEEQAKTNIALWQWSLFLQRKVLVAWVAYTADKKRKQARFEVAMATSRKRLLRDGAAQWLSVASYLASEREKFAAQKQAQNAFTSYQIVHRCAMKWRQKTHDRRNARPSKKHNLKQNKLIQPPVPHPSSTEPLMSVTVGPAQEVGLASIDRLLSGLRGRQRPQPRRPAFLMDSLQKEGLWQDPITPNERKVEDSSNATLFITEHSPERYTQTEHKLTVVEDELIDSGFVRRDKGDTKDKQPQRLPTFMEAPVGSKPVLIPPSVFMKPPAHKDHTTVVAKQKSHLRQVSSSDDSSDDRDDEPLGLPVPHHQPVTPPLQTSFEVTSPSWASSVRDETSPHGNQERKPHPKSELVLLPPDAFISGKKHQESSERLTLQQELEDIRDKLKTFQQLKSKLRSLKEQDKQLTEWLKNQDSSAADGDLEIQDVIGELHESEMEIKELEKQIQFEKPGAMKLATRAQELIKQVE